MTALLNRIQDISAVIGKRWIFSGLRMEGNGPDEGILSFLIADSCFLGNRNSFQEGGIGGIGGKERIGVCRHRHENAVTLILQADKRPDGRRWIRSSRDYRFSGFLQPCGFRNELP